MMFIQIFSRVLHLYFMTYLSWPDWLYFYSFFSYKDVDPYDHYAACCVPLTCVYEIT